MLEYRTVREAAEAWGVSERRVHKLCKDGRIDGLIRLGNAWGIPQGVQKPCDARKAGEARRALNYARAGSAGMQGDVLGPDAKLLTQSENCAVFQLENETGNGIVTIYDTFPGVQLMYSDLHMLRITDHDSLEPAPDTDMLVINHCREGRFECEFLWGECGYMGEGDMAVSRLPTPLRASSFPLAHYHGISIMADIAEASKTIDELASVLGIVRIDMRGIKERLLAERPYFLVRSSEAVSHIFSELYNAPDTLKESYIRLKLIELLLFLGIAEPVEEAGRRYFYRTRVNAVKAMRDYLVAHLDRHSTLSELSERFNIPLTAMKSCFKSVFGMPIHAYMRQYRLQTASVLLRKTDEPVSQIAARVGYESHAQFSSAFKSALGMSPSEYRKVPDQNL